MNRTSGALLGILGILMPVALGITGALVAQSTMISTSSPRPLIFHDGEPLIGRVGSQYSGDPGNTIFRLATMPVPDASLILVSDGRVLTQGLDYTLRNDGTVEIIEAKHAPRRSLQAWYRSDK